MPANVNNPAAGSPLPGTVRNPFKLRAGLTFVGLLATGLAVVVLSREGIETGPAAARLAAVAVPFGFGLYRLARAPSDHFGLLLLAAASMWSLTILSESHSSSLYSVGRLSVWLVEPMLVFLILSFPSGRLTTPTQRRLAAAAAILVAVLFVPSAFLGPFPTPTPWADCGTSCPSNALQISHTTTALTQDVLRPARELLAVVLFALVSLEVVRRARREGKIMRQILTTVAVVAMVRTVALLVYFAQRMRGDTSDFTNALGWTYVLSLPAIALAFAAGSLAHRLFVAGALERLTQRLSTRTSARELRETLADALGDPKLELRFSVPESPSGWIEETGWPAVRPTAGPGRAVTEVATDGRVVAAITHDRALSQDIALLAGVSSYTVAALENQQLLTDLRTSLEELTASRARLVAVADQERRKIERDLHDGAQQRLVALQIKLGLLAEDLAVQSPVDAAHVRAFEDDVEATLDEVRRFARGLYPPLLADRGLSDALHAVARSAPIPTTVDAQLTHRYPREVESAVYFACLEALQNVAKHARGATNAAITLSGNGRLRFDVRDNGCGFDPANASKGAGLTNMSDRVGALGGELWIEPLPTGGTRVSGMIPLSSAATALEPPHRA